MLNEAVRNKFKELKLSGERSNMSSEEKISSDIAIIEYMNYLISKGYADDFEDVCFCLWNLSDSYALRRDSEELYKNHVRFANYIGDKSKYSFWTVCDATQKFTLYLGGYGDFWQGIYQKAAEAETTDENYRIAYESHRTAMSIHPSLKIPKEHLVYADKKFTQFLERSKHRNEYTFYKLIYFASATKAFSRTDIDFEALCAEFFDYLKEQDVPSEFLIGEWGQLNCVRSKRNRAVVGITAAVNALIDTGEASRAAKLYAKAKVHGLPENAYINKRIVAAQKL